MGVHVLKIKLTVADKQSGKHTNSYLE